MEIRADPSVLKMWWMETKWWCVWRRRASAFADSVYRGPCINHLNDSVNPLTIGSERRRRLGLKSPIQNVRNAAGPTTTVGLAIAAIGCEHPKWKLALAKERAKKTWRAAALDTFLFSCSAATKVRRAAYRRRRSHCRRPYSSRAISRRSEMAERFHMVCVVSIPTYARVTSKTNGNGCLLRSVVSNFFTNKFIRTFSENVDILSDKQSRLKLSNMR